MKDGFVKIVLLLRFEGEVERVLKGLSRGLKKAHNDCFIPYQDGAANLPFHITILPSGPIPAEEIPALVRKIRKSFKMFGDQAEQYRARITKKPKAQAGQGDYILIRLDLDYILTGNRKRNKKLAERLNQGFSLDGIKHITIGRVIRGDEDSVYLNTDKILRALSKALHGGLGKKIKKSILIPEIWIKDQNGWRRYDG